MTSPVANLTRPTMRSKCSSSSSFQPSKNERPRRSPVEWRACSGKSEWTPWWRAQMTHGTPDGGRSPTRKPRLSRAPGHRHWIDHAHHRQPVGRHETALRRPTGGVCEAAAAVRDVSERFGYVATRRHARVHRNVSLDVLVVNSHTPGSTTRRCCRSRRRTDCCSLCAQIGRTTKAPA